MKNNITTTLLIIGLFAAYSFGQVNNKPPVKNCCCEHTQQMAEDLRWIREQMSKPFVGKEHVLPTDSMKPELPNFKQPKPKDVNFNVPKAPKR